MKTPEQILEDRRLKQKEQSNSSNMLSQINRHTSMNNQNSTMDLQQSINTVMDHWDDMNANQQQLFFHALSKLFERVDNIENNGVKANNLEDLPDPKTNVTVVMPDMDKMNDEHAASMEKFAQAFTKLTDSLDKIDKAIARIADIKIPPIELPHITIPEIKVPDVQVNYQAPDIKVPKPTVIVQEAEKEEYSESKCIAEDYSYVTRRGVRFLDGIIETYADGSTTTVTGISTGKIRYAYS